MIDIETLDTLESMVDVTAHAMHRWNTDVDTAVHLTRHFIGQTMQGLGEDQQIKYADLIIELMQNTIRARNAKRGRS